VSSLSSISSAAFNEVLQIPKLTKEEEKGEEESCQEEKEEEATWGLQDVPLEVDEEVEGDWQQVQMTFPEK